MGFDGSTSTSSEAAARANSDALLAAVNTTQDALYRPILIRDCTIVSGTGSATRLIGTGESAAKSTSTAAAAACCFPIVTTDYAYTGKTTKLNLQATCMTNATSHGTQTFTVHLYSVSGVAGGADTSTVTLGSSQTSVAFVDPSTSSNTTTTGSDITIPATGLYVLALHNSASTAASAFASFSVSLRYRHV